MATPKILEKITYLTTIKIRSKEMGYVEFSAGGIAYRMEGGAFVSAVPSRYCDACFNDVSSEGGIEITNVDKEVVLWICSKCRKR
jgi:hypothetical protein